MFVKCYHQPSFLKLKLPQNHLLAGPRLQCSPDRLGSGQGLTPPYRPFGPGLSALWASLTWSPDQCKNVFHNMKTHEWITRFSMAEIGFPPVSVHAHLHTLVHRHSAELELLNNQQHKHRQDDNCKMMGQLGLTPDTSIQVYIILETVFPVDRRSSISKYKQDSNRCLNNDDRKPRFRGLKRIGSILKSPPPVMQGCELHYLACRLDHSFQSLPLHTFYNILACLHNGKR